jgi:hypothetical protein
MSWLKTAKIRLNSFGLKIVDMDVDDGFIKELQAHAEKCNRMISSCLPDEDGV